MKKIITLYLLLLITTNCFSQWIPLTTGGIVYNNSISFVTENTGYIAEGNGLKKTTDGGYNWIIVCPSGSGFYQVSFRNYNNGIAVGTPPNIVCTSDGGVNWLNKTGTINNSLYCCFMEDSLISWIGGSDCIFKTTDGGNNWINQTTGLTSFSVSDLFFRDLNNGWATLQSGKILRTTNSGSNWNLIETGMTQLYSISFGSPNTGWAVGGYYSGGNVYEVIIKTTNGGLNWVQQLSGNSYFMKSVYCKDLNTCWVVGSNLTSQGIIIKTTNGGSNWAVQYNSNSSLNDVQFQNAAIGWAVGNDNTVLKTTNGGSVFVRNISTEVPISYSLSQNYPNPFNPRTKIRFTIPNLSFPNVSIGNPVLLQVYDVMGCEVQTLVNERLNPGTYETTFDGSNFSSGVYFYRLITDGYSETKRMLLIK